jgi:hypothetical protein
VVLGDDRHSDFIRELPSVIQAEETMDCVLCYEPVTNPVCQDCLAEAIEQWLWEVAPERVDGLHEETRIIRAADGIGCIRCHKHFSVCTYCYTKHIFNWLRNTELQLEFVEFFNFDMYKLKPYAVDW